MTFLRADGKVCPCMARLHNGYIWMNDVRRKFDDFDFASCLYCGYCELFAENTEDCIGNTHPACGGCLWAEGVLSCP